MSNYGDYQSQQGLKLDLCLRDHQFLWRKAKLRDITSLLISDKIIGI